MFYSSQTGYPFPQKDLEWLGKFNEVNAFDCVWLRRNLNPVFEKFQSDTQGKAFWNDPYNADRKDMQAFTLSF